MIPKIIHQYYSDQTMKDVPKEWVLACDTWYNLNPTWEYRRWSDADMITLINQQRFFSAEEFCKDPSEYKACLVKYELLNRLGGLWMDLNLKCVKPLPDFLESFLGADYTGNATGKIMASSVNSDFTNKLIHIASLDTPNSQRIHPGYLHLQKLQELPEIKPRTWFCPNDREGNYICPTDFPVAEYIYKSKR